MNKRKWVPTKKTLRTYAAVVTIACGVIASFAKLYPLEGVGEWTGFGKDVNESESTEETIKDGKIISTKKTKAKNFQSAKTLWDWLQTGWYSCNPIGTVSV